MLATMPTETNSIQQPTSGNSVSDLVDALLEAARYDDLDDVISLYSLGVSLNAQDSQGRTALHMAAANGHVDIVEYLIRNGVARGTWRLWSSDFMLASGHASDFLRLAVNDVNTSNTEKNTPLHWACLNGKKEVVRALILAGANVSLLNSYEHTPMDEAVARGEMDVVDAINAVVAQAELQGVGVF